MRTFSISTAKRFRRVVVPCLAAAAVVAAIGGAVPAFATSRIPAGGAFMSSYGPISRWAPGGVFCPNGECVATQSRAVAPHHVTQHFTGSSQR
jgi:hypothetical protein